MTEEQLNQEQNYSASNIQVLEGLEAVRKRPAMYIGDISEKGLHHLVNETVDNSIDEAMAGYCTHIEVTINEDNSITVQDNGRGIPVDEHEKMHKSALEVVMTVLHAGGKFDKGSYKVSGGLHGVGVSCVNALSTHMMSQVFRNGHIYQQEYEKGKPLYDVKIVGDTDKTGTRQQFWPDGSIFTTTEYKYDIIAKRMRELAYLNAGITITLTDLRPDEEGNLRQPEVFHAKEGLKEFVRYVDRHRTSIIGDPICLKTEKDGVPIEVALLYNSDYSENIHSYVNNINTIEGGTHLTGFRIALARTLKKYADEDDQLRKQIEKAKIEVAQDDFREGLTAIISVKVAEPQFEGQTKTKLGNSEVNGAVQKAVGEAMTNYLEEHPKEAHTICEKVILAATALSTHQLEVLDELNRRLSLLRTETIVRLEHALESPLGPLIVDRIASTNLALPIKTETNLIQLRAIAVDILEGCLFRVLTCLDGILLSRKSVSIVSHRIQHVEALLTLVASIDITGDVAKGMTHVQACSTRIREHVQHIELLLVLVLHHAIGSILHPSLLPFLFDFSEIVVHCIFVLIVSVHYY